jgi:hypothetical protein
MRKLALAVCLMFACSPFALAQEKKEAKKEPTAAQKAQQERMKSCNDQAGAKKMEGDARKKFMSTCLKGEDHAPSAKQKAQQDKMTACNKTAGDKKLAGEERKKFMSTCLSG